MWAYGVEGHATVGASQMLSKHQSTEMDRKLHGMMCGLAEEIEVMEMLPVMTFHDRNVTSVDPINLVCLKHEVHPLLALEGWERTGFIITLAAILLVELFAKCIIHKHIMEFKFKDRPINILLMADQVKAYNLIQTDSNQNNAKCVASVLGYTGRTTANLHSPADLFSGC